MTRLALLLIAGESPRNLRDPGKAFIARLSIFRCIWQRQRIRGIGSPV